MTDATDGGPPAGATGAAGPVGPVDHEASFRANRALWDAWTAVHATGDFYDLDGFRRGGVRLRDHEIAAVGDVAGRTLLHLQCHFGIDTLSWARLGARVTGADFSPAAIRLARELAIDLGFPDARFVESNVYELPDRLSGTFDIVYTSRGVLGWLPDVGGWARVVAHFLAPGGTFYITEVHPVAQVFENEGVSPGELRLAYPYWEHRDPLVFEVTGSYADRDADVGDQREHGWDHGLGEIVNALIGAGLRIESLEEHPWLDWSTDFLVEADAGADPGAGAGTAEVGPPGGPPAPGSGRFVLPPGTPGELPLMFSLRASKPAD